MRPGCAAARVLLASTLVAAGEWTTYGDLGLAATGAPAARLVARLAAAHPGFANAHRVLRSGGVVTRGPGAGDRERRAREQLEAEGVVFRGRVADPRQRVGWLAIHGRLLALDEDGTGAGVVGSGGCTWSGSGPRAWPSRSAITPTPSGPATRSTSLDS